jgi:hypothetical protein
MIVERGTLTLNQRGIQLPAAPKPLDSPEIVGQEHS